MLTVYAHPESDHSRKVVNLIKFMNLDHENIYIALEKGAHQAPEFLEINPHGKVPVIDHDGFVLRESGAIVNYLARAFDRTDLLGGEKLQDQAIVNQWVSWQSSELSPTCGIINFVRIVAPLLGFGDGTDTPAVTQAVEKLNNLAKLTDKTLAKQTFLTGDTITVADIVAGTMFNQATTMRVDHAQYTNLNRWLDALREARAI